jgi:hypothetical protein
MSEVKLEWSAEATLTVKDETGRVCFKQIAEWPVISPKKVSLIEDLLAEAQMKFKKAASLA